MTALEPPPLPPTLKPILKNSNLKIEEKKINALADNNVLFPVSLLVSAATNRPVPDGEKAEPEIPAFWCTICSVHLNMPLQAIQHFSGKSHATKLTRMKNQSFGRHLNQNSNLTDANRKREHDLREQSQLESFQSIQAPQQLEVKTPAILPPIKTDSDDDKKLVCHDCDTMFNSLSQADQHFKGRKHALVVGTKNAANFKKVPVISNKGEQAIDAFHCNHCNISLNSTYQFTQHCNGIRHKLQSGIITEPPEWWVEQQDGFDQTYTKRSSGQGVGEQYRCEPCNKLLNSESQLGLHLASKNHKEVIERQSAPPRGGGRDRGASRGRVGGRGYSDKQTRGRGVMQRGRGTGGNFSRDVNLQRNGRGSSLNRGRGTSRGNRGAFRGRGNNRDKGSYNYTSTGGQCGPPLVDESSPNFMPVPKRRRFGSFNNDDYTAPIPNQKPFGSTMNNDYASDSYGRFDIDYSNQYASFSPTPTPIHRNEIQTLIPDQTYDSFYQVTDRHTGRPPWP